MSQGYPFLKGHGTENDFVLLPDPDGRVHADLSPALVRALCDRRAGIGADGVLRVVRSAAYHDPAAGAAVAEAEWFMDYRNADGSASEMCGNGIRVFARYLVDYQGADPSAPLAIGTRDGTKTVWFADDGTITADMGIPEVLGEAKVAVGEHRWAATHVSMGNPHAVAFVDSLADAGDLLREPAYDAADYPDGVNVEFVVRRGPGHLAMRVHERGSGETRSCGTGACAAMVAAAVADGVDGAGPAGEPGRAVSYDVDVPGGRLRVTWTEQRRVLLAGPAVIVAEGRVANSFPGPTGGVRRSR